MASSAAALLVVSLTGCVVVDKDIDPGTDTGTMSVSSTAGEGTTTLDDTGLPTTGVSSTDTTDTNTTSEVGTTAAPTTGGAPDVQGACEAACMVFLECQPGAYPDLATCAAECLGGAVGGPGCEAAAAVFNTCIGGYTCEQLAMALEDNQFGACSDAFADYSRSCGG